MVFDVTLVDDEGFVVTAAVPTSLLSKFKRVVTLLVEIFEHHGMTINWSPGKAETILVLRGKKAREEKRKISR